MKSLATFLNGYLFIPDQWLSDTVRDREGNESWNSERLKRAWVLVKLKKERRCSLRKIRGRSDKNAKGRE
jgi:hypothetical protein